MNKKNNPRTHKVIARTSEDDYIRLTIIAKRYGFKSVYGLLVYVVHCFLQTADRTYYNTPRDLEKKLRRMFPIDEDAGKLRQFLYRNRKTVKVVKGREPDLFDASSHKTISEEIHEMFSECEEGGRHTEFPDRIRKRDER